MSNAEHHPGPTAGPVTGPSRRAVLGYAGAGLVGAAASLAVTPSAQAAFTTNPFACGVASGEPDSTSVVLWTRIAPSPHLVDMGMAGVADQLDVRVQLRRPGAAWGDAGTVVATRAHGYSVKRIVTGLDPHTPYEYRFLVEGWSDPSPVGTTQTLPATGSTEACRFAVLSCMSIGHDNAPLRYFHGLRHLHERTGGDTVDFVVHIGDYIYEDPINATDADGGHDGGCFTLAHYRTRYGVVRRRLHARLFHQKLPVFHVPDDHEVWNDVCGGAGNLGGLTETRTVERYNQALKAWWENTPTRAGYQVVNGRAELTKDGTGSLGQRIRWGTVLDLLLTDTRLQRNNPGDETSTILGRTQREWLLPRIADESRTWCAVATGVPYARVSSDDKWSGYPSDRHDVGVALRGRPNAVILSGDIHCGVVVRPRASVDGVQRVVATEFVGPPVTSDTSTVRQVEGDVLGAYNDRWGYLLCAVSPTSFTARYCMTTSVTDPDADVTLTPAWRVPAGAPKGTAERV